MKFKNIVTNRFFLAFLVGIGSLHLIKEISLRQKKAPPPLVYVKDWVLTDQNGQPFGKKDLQGKLVIADFFFTSCRSICPKLTHAMKEVHARFLNSLEKVHFISISVDPENDTPSVLKKFMEDFDLNVPNWHSLTGRMKDIHDVVVKKMSIHVGEKTAAANDTYDIPHIAKLALFDQNGDLRGLFNTDSIELAALVRAANLLLETEGR